MEKLNWGIIGLGRIAENFSKGFLEVNNANLLAVASKDLVKLKKYKDDYNLEEKFLFKNYEDLINCSDVDIIYIALPNSLHYYWTSKIIDIDKNVLVEKPATIKFCEAETIYKKLVNKNLFFGEAFMYRFLPQTELVTNCLKNAEIGEINSMISSFGMNILTKKKFLFFNKKKKIDPDDRKFNLKLGGGSIYDLGCYPSSFSLLINSFLGQNKIDHVKVFNIFKEIGKTGVDIHSSAELSFESGFNSKIFSSFKKNLGNKSIIYGKNGKIILEDTWKGKSVIIQKNFKKTKEYNFTNRNNIYSYQIEKISENILKGIKRIKYPGMKIEETVSNMQIIENWLKG